MEKTGGAEMTDMKLAHDIIATSGAYISLNAAEDVNDVFAGFDTIISYAKALPGVSFETMCRLPTLPRRTVVDGKHMVAVLFDDIDNGRNIVAWPPQAPDDIYLWVNDASYVLGREKLQHYAMFGIKVVEHDTPLQWLQSDLKGICRVGGND